MHRYKLEPGTPEYGHAFEHLVMQEIIAYLGYKGELDQLSYWHAYSGEEVDAIIGDAKIAIEIKSADEIQRKHTDSLREFAREHPNAKRIVVSRDKKWPVFTCEVYEVTLKYTNMSVQRENYNLFWIWITTIG